MLDCLQTPRGNRLFISGLGHKAQGAVLGMCGMFVTGINGRCVQSAACFEQSEGTSLYHILPSESIP
jgi:hypothetical protein